MPAKRSVYSAGAARRYNWVYTSTAPGSSAWAHKRLRRELALGRAPPGGRTSAVGVGGLPEPTGSDLPHDAAVHAADGRGSVGPVARPRVPRRELTLTEHDGRSPQSQRLPPAQSDQGQTPKKNFRKPMPSLPTSPTRMASPWRRRRLTPTGRSSGLSIDCKPR